MFLCLDVEMIHTDSKGLELVHNTAAVAATESSGAAWLSK